MPKTATVPVRIIRKRSILAATIFMFALAGSFLMAIYYLPLWCKYFSDIVQEIHSALSRANFLSAVTLWNKLTF